MKQNIEYIIRLGSLTQPSGGANGGASGSGNSVKKSQKKKPAGNGKK